MKTEYLLLAGIFVTVGAYLFSVSVQNGYSEAWLDTTMFETQYSPGEDVEFGIDIRNNLGFDETYPIHVTFGELKLDYSISVANRETREIQVSFTLPSNLSFPSKINVDVVGVDNLTLWIFERT